MNLDCISELPDPQALSQDFLNQNLQKWASESIRLASTAKDSHVARWEALGADI